MQSPYQFIVNESDEKGKYTLILIIRGWLPTRQQLITWNKTSEYVSQEDAWEEMQKLPFKTYDRISPYNNQVYTQPRINFACADQEFEGTKYAKVEIPFYKWTPVCESIRNRILKESKLSFNSCLINGYRNENDMVGEHADRESLGFGNAVVTVSIGETRFFSVTRNTDQKELGVFLNSGDLVIMYGAAQKNYKHGIPREKIPRGLRFSITYRVMIPGELIEN